MKTFRSLLLICCAVFSADAVRATTVIPPTFEQLVSEAEVIFQGAVTDVRSQWVGEGAEHRIITFVTFKIDDTLKGEPGETYTLRMLGGTVGDQTMKVTDTPEFKVGDRDILFVEHNGSQFVPLVGIMHGRFHVQQDKVNGREIVAKDDGAPLADMAKLGRDEGAATGGTGISTADFKSAVRAQLARQ